jgi:hypothetical protein
MSDGIFTQPGPDGIFGYGQGGKPLDAASPTIDSDGEDLRETLVAVFPSPGHMRVARAVRNRKTGNVEKYEEFREPTERERAILAQQGVFPPPSAPVAPPVSYPPAPSAYVAPQLAGTNGTDKKDEGWPWFKLAVAAGVGAAALWAAQKYVMPMVGAGEGARENPPDDDDADDGKGDDGED